MKENDNQNDLPNTEKDRYILDNQIDLFLSKLQNSPLLINRLDYYGNSIPLGAFCFAISFIVYGFYECGVFKEPDAFSFAVLFLFGGIGQITAGIFEYIKSRTFPTVIYLLYGLYFISFFFSFYYYSDIYKEKDSRKIFYGTWAGLSFPLVIGSFQTNVVYLLQNIAAFAFFIIRCIGECKDLGILNTTVSGILELVTVFLSLYLCFSQVINEHFRRTILPAFPIKKDNEIDINIQNR